VQSWVVSGDSRVWWEAIVLCRKAGVVLLAVMVANPYLQCVGASLWFLGALQLQLRYAPYSKPLFNRVETASLASTLLTAIISTALLQYNVGVTSSELHPPESMTDIEWTVTVALSVLNVGTFALLVGIWLRAQCTRARGIVRTALSGRVAGILASLTGGQRRLAGITGAGPGTSTGNLGAATRASSECTFGVTVSPLRARVTNIPGMGMPTRRVAFPAVIAGTGSVGVAADAAIGTGVSGKPAGAVASRLPVPVLLVGGSRAESGPPQLGSIMEAPNDEVVATPTTTDRSADQAFEGSVGAAGTLASRAGGK